MGTEATGQEPQVIPEVIRYDAEFAFGTKEGNRLVEDARVGSDAPERGVSAGAILTENAVFRALQRRVSCPRSNPIARLILTEEFGIRLEIYSVAIRESNSSRWSCCITPGISR
jgi:hypothetical protein